MSGKTKTAAKDSGVGSSNPRVNSSSLSVAMSGPAVHTIFRPGSGIRSKPTLAGLGFPIDYGRLLLNESYRHG